MSATQAPTGRPASPPRERILVLRDGRRMGICESGDLDQGTPVIFLHGNPGSRYMRHPDDGLTAGLGVRLIVPDRPGYGLSDGRRERRLLDYPGDITQLADQLGLDRFALFGVSAGGPYVAACAHQIPDRLTGLAIVSGPAPFDRPAREAMAGVNREYRSAYRLAAWPTWALWPTIALHDRAVRSSPERAFAAVYAQASADDQAVLSDPRIAAQIQGFRAEASRKGVSGLVREAQILVAPWGFRLQDIRPRIHLWYWDGDRIVPPQMGRFLQAHIPHTVPHFLPGGGHFSIFSHWAQILTSLRPD